MNFIENFYSQIIRVFSDGVFGLSLGNLAIIFVCIIVSLLIRSVVARVLVSKVKKIVSKTGNKIDDKLFDALVPPFRLLPIVVVFLAITLYFDLESTLGLYLQKINNTLSTIFVFWLIHQALIPFSNLFNKLESILSKGLVLWIVKSLKYLIIFLGIVAVLEVWGIKIGPVIAGLGLFGVAVALGAQDLFKNLISGIMILLEKRFQIGDVINVPGHTEGTVEHIGFRSTLIRKFDSTPITIPNYIFAEAPILNYTNRNYRRINWTIGLEYNSTLDQIKKLTEMISTYFKDNEDFMVDDSYKSFVRIEKFNDSSIDILVICFTSTKDWDKYLEIKEELAMKIKDSVEKIGLNFAFPSQSIYIEKTQDL
jgi:MscS family membrane protein